MRRKLKTISNTRNNRVSSVSKSSCKKNKEVEVEHQRRNLLLCNKEYINLDVLNLSNLLMLMYVEFVFLTCKKCLFDSMHDECVSKFFSAKISRK